MLEELACIMLTQQLVIFYLITFIYSRLCSPHFSTVSPSSCLLFVSEITQKTFITNSQTDVLNHGNIKALNFCVAIITSVIILYALQARLIVTSASSLANTAQL